MGISLSRQLTALLLALACGGICGAVYDVIRLSRVLLGVSEYTSVGRKLYSMKLFLITSVHRPIPGVIRQRIYGMIIALGDVLYGILAGCIFSVFLYHAASGCFRWFYLLGWGIGFLIYYFTVGRLVMLSSEAVVYLFRVCLGYILYLMVLPLRFLLWAARRARRMVHRLVVLPLADRAYAKHCRAYTKKMQHGLNMQMRLTEKGVGSFAKVEE